MLRQKVLSRHLRRLVWPILILKCPIILFGALLATLQGIGRSLPSWSRFMPSASSRWDNDASPLRFRTLADLHYFWHFSPYFKMPKNNILFHSTLLLRACVSHNCPQIMFSSATVMVSGVMLFRWRRLDEAAKGTLWSLYGFFTGFMCFGNCVSVVTGAVYIVLFPNTYYNFKYSDAATVAFKGSSAAIRVKSRFTLDEILGFLASGLTFQAAWQVLCSIDFAFRCATKLMILDRMRDFSVPLQYSARIARWAVLTIVIAGCVVGVCASTTSAVTKTRASSIATQAATAAREAIMLTTNSTKAKIAASQKVMNLWKQSYVIMEEAGQTDSIQQFSEMAVLLLLVVFVLVLGIICAHRVRCFVLRSSLENTSAISTAKYLHRQIVLTAAAVFITFLPRAVFSSMRAVSGALQDVGFDGQADCPIFCSDVVVKPDQYTTGCKKPFNQYTHMSFYLTFAPEFHLIVAMISSSLAQLVALWGMTSQRTLQAFGNNSNRLERLVDITSNTSGE